MNYLLYGGVSPIILMGAASRPGRQIRFSISLRYSHEIVMIVHPSTVSYASLRWPVFFASFFTLVRCPIEMSVWFNFTPLSPGLYLGLGLHLAPCPLLVIAVPFLRFATSDRNGDSVVVLIPTD